jgi:hypothetical protein
MDYSYLNEELSTDYPILRQENEKEGGPYYLKLPHLDSNDSNSDSDSDSHLENPVKPNAKKMPLNIQLYIGGLSIFGLFIIYRLIRKSNSRYI